MSNFCNGLTFVMIKGCKLGCLVCTQTTQSSLEYWLMSGLLWGISKLRGSLSGNLVLRHSVPGRIADEIWWNIRFLGKWVETLLYLSFSPYGLLREENNKSKIYCALLNLDWFHLTGEVPVLINFLKFFLCTLAHRPVDIWRV